MSQVAKQASRMGAATFLSRIGGLVREQVFAHLFGATDVADAFNIAFRIPNLLRDLFAEGAMSAAFVPHFTRALEDSKDRAFKLFIAVIWSLLIALTILSVAGIYFSPQIVALYAAKYQNIPGKYEMTVALTRYMFPFFPLVAMAAVAMGALNALGSFFLPAFAPVLFNLASVFAGFILCPILDRFTLIHPIYGMAWGVVLGGLLQFLVQWVQLVKEGVSIRKHGLGKNWLTPWNCPGVKEVVWLLIPGTVGLAATQLSILINSVYATSSGSGAVSYLNYAFRLMQFPIGIFGVSLAAATLPQVTRSLAGKKWEDAGVQVQSSLRLTFAVNGPAAAGLMGIGLPLIALLFEHGHFNSFASEQTATALFWYSLGLPGYSAVKILVPLFYALGTTTVPVVSSFAMVAVNAALNYAFVFILKWPFWSLALSTSVTASLNAIVLYWFLSRKIPQPSIHILLLNVALCCLTSFLVWLTCRICIIGVDAVVIELVRSGGLFVRSLLTHYAPIWILKIALAIPSSLFVWIACGKLFRIEEIKTSSEIILRRLSRKKM